MTKNLRTVCFPSFVAEDARELLDWAASNLPTATITHERMLKPLFQTDEPLEIVSIKFADGDEEGQLLFKLRWGF